MKLIVVALVCFLWEASAFPYPYYGSNFDTFSYGSSDLNRGGMVLSRYYNPYYNPQAMGGGMAAFMYKPDDYRPPANQYYLPDRRRQTFENTYVPQQNEVYYPQVPDKGVLPEQPGALPDLPPATELADIPEPTEKIDLIPTTVKSISTPELVEPEIEEIPKAVGNAKRRFNKTKQVKRPDEDEEEGQDYPRMPTGTYFPMFFGYGGRSGHGTPNGATAIANAYSTGRGGVATSHATAYGPPRPEYKEKY